MIRVDIGLDSLDTPITGCTTHFAFFLLLHIRKKYGDKIELVDYPNLVRLNPNIPWKTRGNAAVVLRTRMKEDIVEDVIKDTLSLAEAYVGDLKNSSAGIAFYIGDSWQSTIIRQLYILALTDVVDYSLINDLEKKNLVIVPEEVHGHQGVIGAVAAMGGLRWGDDYTYELIAYRYAEKICSKRIVDKDKVREIDEKYTSIFASYDPYEDEIAITPRGCDPVLYGIRGDDPKELEKAAEILRRHGENPLGWLIYRTNQATDAHQENQYHQQPLPYRVIWKPLVIISTPKTLPGGHIVLEAIGNIGRKYRIMVYRETGILRDYTRILRPGDKILAYMSAKPSSNHTLILSIEKLFIKKITSTTKIRNPKCPQCGHTMKSRGKEKGYKCPKCGFILQKGRKIIEITEDRLLPSIITPNTTRIRHLIKPVERIADNRGKLPGSPGTLMMELTGGLTTP